MSTWNHMGTNGKVCSLVLCASVCLIYFSIIVFDDDNDDDNAAEIVLLW